MKRLWLIVLACLEPGSRLRAWPRAGVTLLPLPQAPHARWGPIRLAVYRGRSPYLLRGLAFKRCGAIGAAFMAIPRSFVISKTWRMPPPNSVWASSLLVTWASPEAVQRRADTPVIRLVSMSTFGSGSCPTVSPCRPLSARPSAPLPWSCPMAVRWIAVSGHRSMRSCCGSRQGLRLWSAFLSIR